MGTTWRARLGVIVAVCAACKGAPPAPLKPLPDPVAVDAEAVAVRPMPRTLALAGALVPDQRADIAANVAGRITHLLVDRGSEVGVGAALVEVDRRTAGLSAAEARANLETAEAQEHLAREQCQRNRTLFERGAISREEWDRIDSQCQTTLAAAKAARARANLTQTTVADATVRAPFAGTVFQRLVNLGEYVQPSSPVVTLVSTSILRLQLTVAEADIASVAVGQAVTFTTETFAAERFAATVTIVDPALREATRDLRVEAQVDNHDRRLRPGMSATALLALPEAPRPTVPATAVRGLGLDARVFVLAGGRLEERRVAVGLQAGDFVEIRDGVGEGELVVSRASDALRDGLPAAAGRR